ncbi:polyprotein [bat pestivirus]|uniref:Genome polyprotein n=2 Tax=Pestivirus TaxID=11095 RepID=A0A3G5BHF3_9FLAV|nr:polyprotein [Bat pestivirus BtSk-PestV-1/GX2017]AYV99177.1 polyprotein [Bat pestivirus BtSk-PestV-1/GX2017]
MDTLNFYLTKEKRNNAWDELVVSETSTTITTLKGSRYRGIWEMPTKKREEEVVPKMNVVTHTAWHPHPVLPLVRERYISKDPDYGECPTTNGVFLDWHCRRYSCPKTFFWKIRLDLEECWKIGSRRIGPAVYRVSTTSGEDCTLHLEGDKVICKVGQNLYQWVPGNELVTIYVKTCSDWADQADLQEKMEPKPKEQRVRRPRRDPRATLAGTTPKEQEVTERKKPPSCTLVVGGEKVQLTYRGKTRGKNTKDGIYKNPKSKKSEADKVRKMLEKWAITLVLLLALNCCRVVQSQRVQWFLRDENSTGLYKRLADLGVNRTLHGIWPANICKGMPNETVTDQELRSIGMYDTSEKTNYTCCQLQYHEWKKHGWCNVPNKQVWLENMTKYQKMILGGNVSGECAVQCRHNGTHNIVKQARNEISPMTGCKEGHPFSFAGEVTTNSCRVPPDRVWVQSVNEEGISVSDGFAHFVDTGIQKIRKGADVALKFLDYISRWLPVVEAEIVPYCKTYTVTGMYVHVKNCLPRGLPEHAKIMSPTLIYLGKGDPSHNIAHFFGSGLTKWLLVLLGILGEWYGELASAIYLLLEYGTEWLEHEYINNSTDLLDTVNITVALKAEDTVPGWVWVTGEWVCVKPSWWPTETWVEKLFSEAYHILYMLAAAVINVAHALLSLELVYLVVIIVKVAKGNLIGAVLWCLLLSGAEGLCINDTDEMNYQLKVSIADGTETKAHSGAYQVMTKIGLEPMLMKKTTHVYNTTSGLATLDKYCYDYVNTTNWTKTKVKGRMCGQTFFYWEGDSNLEETYYGKYWVNTTAGIKHCLLRPQVWVDKKGDVVCRRNGTKLILRLGNANEGQRLEIPCDPIETSSMGPIQDGSCVYSWATAPPGWYYDSKDHYWQQYVKKGQYQYWTKMPTTSSATNTYRHLLPLLIAALLGGRVTVWLIAMLLSFEVEASEVGAKQLATSLTLWRLDTTELLFYLVLMLIIKEEILKKVITCILILLKNSPIALAFLVFLRLAGGATALPVGLLLEKMTIGEPGFGGGFLIYLWENWKWTVLCSFAALNCEQTAKIAQRGLMVTQITALFLTGISDYTFLIILSITNFLAKCLIYMLGYLLTWVESEKLKLYNNRRMRNIWKLRPEKNSGKKLVDKLVGSIEANTDFTPVKLELLQLLRAFFTSCCFNYYKPLLYAETTLTIVLLATLEYKQAMSRGRTMLHKIIAVLIVAYQKLQGLEFNKALLQYLFSNPYKIMKHTIDNPILKEMWRGNSELYNQSLHQGKMVHIKSLGLSDLRKGMCGLPTPIQNLVVYAKKNDMVMIGEVGYSPDELDAEGWQVMGPGKIPKVTKVEKASMDLLSVFMTFMGLETSKIPRTPLSPVRKLYKIVRGFETGWAYSHQGGISTAKHVTGEKNLMTHMPGKKGKYMLQEQHHEADEVEYGAKTDLKVPENSLCYCYNPEATNIKGEAGAIVFMKRQGNKWILVTSEGHKAFYSVKNLKGWSGLPIFQHSTGNIVGRIKAAYSNLDDTVEELIDSKVLNKAEATTLDYTMKELKNMKRGEFKSITLGTGAGKTTELPRLYLTSIGLHKSVLVLVPLRAPAQSVCEYMKRKHPMINFSIRVGEKREGDLQSGITYATYGYACQLNEQQLKEWASRYSMIFMDEYHTATPELLALISKLHYYNVNTRFVAMSATPPGVVTTEGRRFEIEEVGVATAEKNEDAKKGRMKVAGLQIPEEVVVEKNNLVFVATKEEAEREANNLRGKGVNAHPYYSGLDPTVLNIAMKNQPYTIISTNAIESGITCPNLDTVIDTMYKYEKSVTLSAKLPFITTSLLKKRITREEQGQRKGRVGREKRGVYYYPNGVAPTGSRDLSYLLLQAQEYGVIDQINTTEAFIQMNEDWGLFDVDEVEVRILERLNKELLKPLGIVEKQILERCTHPEKVALLYNKMVQQNPLVYPKVEEGEATKDYITYNLAVYDKVKDVNPVVLYLMSDEERTLDMLGLEVEQNPANIPTEVEDLQTDLNRYMRLSGFTEKLLIGTMIGYTGYKFLTRNHVPWVKAEYTYEMVDSEDTYDCTFAPLDIEMEDMTKKKDKEEQPLSNHKLEEYADLFLTKTKQVAGDLKNLIGKKIDPVKAQSLWDKVYNYLKDHQDSIQKSALWGLSTALHDSIKARLGDEVATIIVLAKYLAFGESNVEGLSRQVVIDLIVYYILNRPRFEGDDYAKKKGRRLVVEVLIGALSSYAISNYWGVSVTKLLQPISDYLPYATAALSFLRPTFMESAVVVASSIYRAFLSIKAAQNRSMITQLASAALEVMGLTPMSAGLGVLLGLGLCALHTTIERSEEKRVLIMKLFVKNFVDQAALDELAKMEPEKIILSLLEGIQTCTNPVRAVMILYRVYYRGESFPEALSKMAGKSLLIMCLLELHDMATAQGTGDFINFNSTLLDLLVSKFKELLKNAASNIKNYILPIPYYHCTNWQTDPRVRAPLNYDEVSVVCECGARRRVFFREGQEEVLEEQKTGTCRNFTFWGPNYVNPDPLYSEYFYLGVKQNFRVNLTGDNVVIGKYGIYLALGINEKGERYIKATSHSTVSREELISITSDPKQIAVGTVKLSKFTGNNKLISRSVAVVENDKIHFWKYKAGSKVTDDLRPANLLKDIGAEARDIDWKKYKGGTFVQRGVSLRSCAPNTRTKGTVLCNCTTTLSPCYLVNGGKPTPFVLPQGYECHHSKKVSWAESYAEMEDLYMRRVPVLDELQVVDVETTALPMGTLFRCEDQHEFEYQLRCWGLGVVAISLNKVQEIRVHQTSRVFYLNPDYESKDPIPDYVKGFKHQLLLDQLLSDLISDSVEEEQDESKSLTDISEVDGDSDILSVTDDRPGTPDSMPPLEGSDDDNDTVPTIAESGNGKLKFKYILEEGLHVSTFFSDLTLGLWIEENVQKPHKVKILEDGAIVITVKEGEIKHLVGTHPITNELTAMFREAIASLPAAQEKPIGRLFTAQEMAQGNVNPISGATNYYGKVLGESISITPFEALSNLRHMRMDGSGVVEKDLQLVNYYRKHPALKGIKQPDLQMKNLIVVGKLSGRKLVREEVNIPNKKISSILHNIGINLSKLPVVRANTSSKKFREAILEKMDKPENAQVEGLHEKMWQAFLVTAKVEWKNKLEEVDYQTLEEGINRKGAAGFLEKEKNIGEVLEDTTKIDEVIRKVNNRELFYYETAIPKNEKRGVLDDWMTGDYVTYKKPRVIQYPEAKTRLAITKILYRWVKQKPVLIPGYEGKTPMFELYENIYEDWKTFKDPVAVCFDTKAWDTQVTSKDLDLVGKIQKYYYKKKYWKFIDNLTSYMKNVLVITVEGDCFIRRGQRGSGQPDTSAGNSILNVLTMLVAFSEATNLPLRAAWSAVKFHVCGDDGFLITERTLGEKFSSEGIAILSSFGKPQKIVEGGNLKLALNYTDIEFCSHQPIKVNTPNVSWMPGRDTSTILGKMTTRLGEGPTRSGEEYEKQVAFAYLLMYPWNPLVRRVALLVLSTTENHYNTLQLVSDEGISYQGDPIAAYRSVWGHSLDEVKHVDTAALSKFNYSMTYLGIWKEKTTKRLLRECLNLAEKGNLPVRADSLVKKKSGKLYEPREGVALVTKKWEELVWKRTKTTFDPGVRDLDLFETLVKEVGKRLWIKIKLIVKMFNLV